METEPTNKMESELLILNPPIEIHLVSFKDEQGAEHAGLFCQNVDNNVAPNGGVMLATFFCPFDVAAATVIAMLTGQVAGMSERVNNTVQQTMDTNSFTEGAN